MATLNQCTFIGRLGKDPELGKTANGKPIAKFTLAVDQGKDQPAMWLNCERYYDREPFAV